MNTKSMTLFAILGIALFTGSITYAQESMNLRVIENSRLRFTGLETPAPTAVTVSEDTPTVVEAPTPKENPTVVTNPTPASVTCTKTVTGDCTLFTCSDGTKTNTCDIMCKETKPVSDAPIGAVATDEPKITSVFPNIGNAGTIVKVYLTKGQKNFSGPDSIEVGGVPVPMTKFGNVPGSKADFILEFTLPANAKTGKIAIKKPGTFKNTAYSDSDFIVIPEQDAPYISEIKPSAGYAGQEVTVEYFMGTKKFSALDSVEIGGIPATVTLSSDVWAKKPNAHMVKFKIPENAKTGKITLNKKIFGSVSSANDFIVVPATDSPTILSFSPAGGKIGTEVTIKAVPGKKNFSGLDGIYIGETKAEIITQSADTSGIRTFVIQIPENAKTGKITLRKPGAFLDVSTTTDFEVYGAVKSLYKKVVGFFMGN